MKGQLILALMLAMGVILIAASQVLGSSTITVKQSNVEPGGRGCVSGEWHLVINQIERSSLAPSSVDVTFSDGHTHTKSLSKFTGKVAHYSIFDHLTDTLVTATADIYDGWPGQFVVSHSPCIPVCEEEPCDTSTPTPTPSATPTPTPSPTPTSTPTGTPTVSTSTSETPLSLPNTGGEPSESGGLDWLGIFMLIAAIGAIVYGTFVVGDAINGWWKRRHNR